MNVSSKQAPRIILTVLALFGLAALACGGGTAVPTTAPTAAPLDTQAPAPTNPPPTKAPIAAPTDSGAASVLPTLPSGAGVQAYVDDFSSDQGNWEVFNSNLGSSKIDKGVLLLGPFNDCSESGSGSPFGCFTQCLWCGTLVSYDISVDAAYISGDPAQTFGMVLRFQDVNGNGLVDPEDYYLDFELSSANQFFAVYQHLPNQGWSTLDKRQEATILTNDINKLRAVAYQDGTKIDVYLNGQQVETLDVKSGSAYGTIGLVTGFKGMQAGFDNFNITLPAPAKDISGKYSIAGTNPDGSTYTGQVTITPSSNGYDIVWDVGNGQQKGNGRLSDYVFSARYATVGSDVVGSATYVLQSDGSLQGTWRDDGKSGVGIETLTPAS